MRKRSKSEVRASDQARQDVADTLRRYGPATIEDVTNRSGYSRNHTVTVVRQLCVAGVVHVVDTIRNGGSGRPLRIYGLVGVHSAATMMRDRIVERLADDGPSPSLELARRMGIHPKTARYHLGRLLAERRVNVVGKIKRKSGGYPAAIWSADV